MIVLIGGEKGGSGKTTLATNLSAWLACVEQDVLLLDADRQLTATKWAALRHLQQPVLPVIHCVQKYGNLVPAVRDLRTRYQHIIIDTRGGDSEELRSAMTVADKLYSPAKASPFDQWTREHNTSVITLARAFNPRLEARMVIAMAPTNPRIDELDGARADFRDQAEQDAARQAERDGGLDDDYAQQQLLLSEFVMHERKAYRDAAGEGKGVIEIGLSKAAREIDYIAKEIYGVEVPIARDRVA